jgi:hypothetical protein
MAGPEPFRPVFTAYEDLQIGLDLHGCSHLYGFIYPSCFHDDSQRCQDDHHLVCQTGNQV